MAMLQRLCPRCHHVVLLEDESTLVFCGNCGAPQVKVSEELLDKNARATAAIGPNGEHVETDEERAARIASQPPDLLIQWKSVIRITLVVCGAISAACLILPLEILAWLAPGVVLGIYASRHRQTQVTASMGARIGLVCGILCAFGIAMAETVQMLVRRFVLHQGSVLDAQLMQQIVVAKARAVAQSGEVAAAPIFNPLLDWPEFRVGLCLAVILFVCFLLMALSTLSGAFSGYMRSRRALR
jgi:ribosomal protein S27AE